jgi:nitroimidazol reductase NimA-like FMN-containing flavoprotein (pyridoxamine 5'-phosphate oxidase superfamily)
VTAHSRQVLTGSVRRFLGTPRLARLWTRSADGYPPIVPIDFARDGETLIFGTDRDEANVRNGRRNPKAAVVIGGDPDRASAGYMIQGDLAVEEDPPPSSIRRLLRRYKPKDEAEDRVETWEQGEVVLLRLSPRRVFRVW